jgi:hypothetical protein
MSEMFEEDEEDEEDWDWESEDEDGYERDTITSTSCILFGSNLLSAPGMSDSFWVFDDFGDAINYFGDLLLQRYKPKKGQTPEEDVARRRKAAERFKTLSEHFGSDGYQPEMKAELSKYVGWYISDIWLEDEDVYVLPHDLAGLLDYTGNPFKSRWDDDEEEEDAESYTARFDLNNPDHCRKLYHRIYESIL